MNCCVCQTTIWHKLAFQIPNSKFQIPNSKFQFQLTFNRQVLTRSHQRWTSVKIVDQPSCVLTSTRTKRLCRMVKQSTQRVSGEPPSFFKFYCTTNVIIINICLHCFVCIYLSIYLFIYHLFIYLFMFNVLRCDELLSSLISTGLNKFKKGGGRGRGRGRGRRGRGRGGKKRSLLSHWAQLVRPKANIIDILIYWYINMFLIWPKYNKLLLKSLLL